MIVNVEFLDKDPIENMITCLNFKVDKVVYLGDEEDIKDKKDSTQRFLKKYCNVKEVEFFGLSETNLDEVIQSIDEVVEAYNKEA